MGFIKSRVYLAAVALSIVGLPASAADWFVAPGGVGSGTSTAPFGRVQDGLNAAHAGDTVSVFPGTYEEYSRRSGVGLPATHDMSVTTVRGERVVPEQLPRSLA